MKKVHILAVGVHPDDVELGCAGTILAQQAKGYTVAILDLTQGELGTRGDAKTRLKEAQAAAKILGVKHRENLGMRDGFFQNDESHQSEIIKIIRHYAPEVVLANAPYDRHPDHGRAAALVRDACFLAGLPKIKTIFQGKTQAAHRPRVVYHYVQALQVRVDFAVDISPYMETKLKAVCAYQSQFYNPKATETETFISTPEFLEFVRARASHFGVPIGVRYAEGFTVNRYLGLRDLMSLF